MSPADGRIAAGRRRDTETSRSAESFSSVAGLLGTAVLVVAGVGAVSVDSATSTTLATSAGTAHPAAQARVLSGTDATSAFDTSSDRERAVSRDFQREALEDAADAKLQKVAEAQARERDAALHQLARSAEQHAKRVVSNAWVLPIDPGAYRLTAGFGESSGLWTDTHTGLDFAATSGTPIASIAAGRVTSTGYDGSYGIKTVITLEDGTEVWYCHQASFTVSPGDQVNSGQVIGTVGSTGNSTGSHLHLEVRPGADDPVDPFGALTMHGLRP